MFRLLKVKMYYWPSEKQLKILNRWIITVNLMLKPTQWGKAEGLILLEGSYFVIW